MQNLELFIKLSSYALLVLTFVIFIISIIQKVNLLPFATKWLIYFIGGVSIYAVVEWLLFNVIFRKSFIYFDSVVLPVIKYLEIQDMNFLAPVSYLIKFIFLSLFFRDLIKNESWKKIFQYLMYGLVFFELVQVFVFKSYQSYDSLSSTVKNTFILFGCSLFLYKFYKTDSGTLVLQKNPYFWIILGLLIPTLAEFFLEFIFQRMLEENPTLFYKQYLVRNASQIVGFILLGIGIYYSKFLQFLPKSY